MADEDGNGGGTGGLRLRVDRLAAAMEAARARARAEADAAPPADAAQERRAVPPEISGDPVPASAPTGPHGDAAEGPGAMDATPPDAVPRVAPSAEGSDMSDPPATERQVRHHPPAAPEPGHTRAEARGMAPPDRSPLLLTPDFHLPEPAPEPSGDRADTRGTAVEPGDAPGIFMPTAPVTPAPPVSPATAAALLALKGVATDIGRYRILEDVTLDVPRGAVTMLLGRNGAGKTTTLRTVMGLWRARAGEIVLAGERIDRWATHRIARAGIGYVPESMSIFGDLTVAENIALGARTGPVSGDRLDWLTGLFPPLATFWRSPAGNLSGGQKQMLALARALVERRRLYLIDEPTKGLAPVIVETVVSALRDLKLQGATILMVEQNFAVARALGDACAVIDGGRVAWSGTMAALADDPALQARLMGLDLGDAA